MSRVSRVLTREEVKSILELCNSLCIEFQVTLEDIKIKPFNNGVDNGMHHVLFKKPMKARNVLQCSTIHSVVIKFFRESEGDYDRMRAVTNAILIGQHGLAPKVLLAREKAIVVEFVKARPFSKKDDNDPLMFKLLAQKLARFNALQVPIPRNILQKTISFRLNDWVPREVIETKFYRDLRPDLERLQCNAFLEHNLADIVDYVKKMIKSTPQLVVYSHANLNHFNILILEESDDICFIDFDYSSYHLRGYDLGRYFVDCESDLVFDDHELIGDEKMLRFIDHYIEECSTIYGNTYKEDPRNSREVILRESKICVLYASLIDVLNCVLMATQKAELRDHYLTNGELRYKAMVQAKKRFQSDSSFV